MRYKKLIAIVFMLVICVVCSVMIYHINSVFPNPENISYHQGETIIYKGLSITVGELELYQENELSVKYPELKDSIDSALVVGSDLEYNYIIANIKVKNTTKQDISLGKESINTWVIEAGDDSNGPDYMHFLAFNPNYSGSFSVGEEMELKVPFFIAEYYLSWEELKKSDIKIIYSYYPTKNYILYKAEERV